MIEPRLIGAADEQVVIKLMDDAWFINECAGGHPFKPRAGAVWSASEHCARLPVPGDRMPDFMREMRDTYGNCAAIAWHGEFVLGHIVFLPRAEARRWQATGSDTFGPDAEDDGTLIVANLAFCSLSGHEFRRRGVGKTLVSIMLAWAAVNRWQKVEVYNAGTGLFPGDWYDACIPPRPFWEKCGFAVFARHCDGVLFEDYLDSVLRDNPRKSDEEQRQKLEIAEAIRRGELAPEQYVCSYNLRREVHSSDD